MSAHVLKKREDNELYPVSETARQRINEAGVRVFAFEARRILSDGGFGKHEIDAILSILIPAWKAGKKISAEEIRRGLVAKQFAKKDAESIASAFHNS